MHTQLASNYIIKFKDDNTSYTYKNNRNCKLFIPVYRHRPLQSLDSSLNVLSAPAIQKPRKKRKGKERKRSMYCTINKDFNFEICFYHKTSGPTSKFEMARRHSRSAQAQ